MKYREMLEDLRRMSMEATPGEWSVVEAGGWYSMSIVEDWMRDGENAKFICALRNNFQTLYVLAQLGLERLDNQQNNSVPSQSGDKTMKPRFRIVVASKNKEDNIKHTIAVAFEKEGGKLSGAFNKAYGDRPGVAKIVLTDGTEIAPDDFWLNFYDEANSPF